MRSPLIPIICFITGAIILAGYFFPNSALGLIRTPMLDWAVTLSAVAGLIAILNLVFGVHWRRLRDPKKDHFFSILVILAFLVTFAAGIFFGPNNPNYQKVVTAVQMPIEASLMAVLAITLAYSSLRLLQRQHNWMGFIFFIAVIIYLLLNSGVLSFFANIPILQTVISGVSQVPIAGARGILIGVALGSLLTGIRIWIGSDRPYNG
ncbi:MAG: hypothetical protein AB9897_04425 [Anaerolineaceae bacterium]